MAIRKRQKWIAHVEIDVGTVIKGESCSIGDGAARDDLGESLARYQARARQVLWEGGRMHEGCCGEDSEGTEGGEEHDGREPTEGVSLGGQPSNDQPIYTLTVLSVGGCQGIQRHSANKAVICDIGDRAVRLGNGRNDRAHVLPRCTDRSMSREDQVTFPIPRAGSWRAFVP